MPNPRTRLGARPVEPGSSRSSNTYSETPRVPAASSDLWTLESCLHSHKTDLVRFLAEETPDSVTSLDMTPKEVLAERLCQLLNKDSSAAERAIRELPVTIGLTPRELEAALSCSRTERRRWVKEGRLPVCATMRLCLKDTHWVDVDLVDRRAVAALAPGTLDSWRTEHRQLVLEHRQAGSIRAAERRARTLALQGQALQEVEQLQIFWLEQSGGDDVAVAALTLAHWAVWASRRAKWHREQATVGSMTPFRGSGWSTRRPLLRHWDQERQWYEFKDQALQLLAGTRWLEIRWYQPSRLWVDKLCVYHYEEWCAERSYTHMSFGEFVTLHENDLVRCSNCKRDTTHYALYSLELRPPFLQESSSYRFHVPYSVGKAYLPQPEKLSHVVEHEASEGLFRFGRALEDEEETAYSGPFIERHLTRALEELAGYLDRIIGHAAQLSPVALPASSNQLS